MCKMEYHHLIKRLKDIRTEIATLKNKPITNVKDRIQLLKETNDLLREQNRILVMRQEYFASRTTSSRQLQA